MYNAIVRWEFLLDKSNRKVRIKGTMIKGQKIEILINEVVYFIELAKLCGGEPIPLYRIPKRKTKRNFCFSTIKFENSKNLKSFLSVVKEEISQ